MRIPEPFNQIINKNYEKADFKSGTWTKIFIDECFSQLIDVLGIKDYQARASKTGEMFEYILWFIMKERFEIDLQNNYEIPKACMMKKGALDFGIIKSGKLLCGIEAKGSAVEIRHSDGRVEQLPRPALKRTDTMKKGICQAYQFKRVFPKVPFFIVTNVKPESGNSKCMMNLAEGDVVDKFIDITDKDDMKYFVNAINYVNKNAKSWF